MVLDEGNSFYIFKGNSRTCDIGYYLQFGICTECPSGLTTATSGANSLTDCSVTICAPGTYKDGGLYGVCTKCPQGTYQNQSNTKSYTCSLCSSGFTTEGKGRYASYLISIEYYQLVST
jgi:hypothetical protein